MLKKIFSTLLLLLSFNQLLAKSNSYYVSPKGSDNNKGNSPSQPFKSIQKAASMVKAGDSVYIMEGTYHETIEIEISGTKDYPISFTNYKNEKVIIDGEHQLPKEKWRGLISIFNQSYINLSNLILKNSTYAGLFMEGANHISIDNLITYNTHSSGVGIWESQYITLTSTLIEKACNGGVNECITVANSQHCTISHNEVKYNGDPTNGGEGIDIKEGSQYIEVFNNHVHHINDCTGIYIDGWDKETHNINVYNNRVHDCNHTGMAMATERGGYLHHVSFFNNVIYNNRDVGILIGGWIHHQNDKPDPKSTPITDIKLINNTLYGNGGGIVVLNKDIDNLIIRNNICSHNSLKSPTDVELLIENNSTHAHITIDHNLFQGRGADDFIEQKTELPIFKNAQKSNFHLRDSSPAIGRASKLFAPSKDFEGKPKLKKRVWDIGAYQH